MELFIFFDLFQLFGGGESKDVLNVIYFVESINSADIFKREIFSSHN